MYYYVKITVVDLCIQSYLGGRKSNILVYEQKTFMNGYLWGVE